MTSRHATALLFVPFALAGPPPAPDAGPRTDGPAGDPALMRLDSITGTFRPSLGAAGWVVRDVDVGSGTACRDIVRAVDAWGNQDGNLVRVGAPGP